MSDAHPRLFTVKLTARQLKDALKALKQSSIIDIRVRDEIVQKLGISFVNNGQSYSDPSHEQRSPEAIERRLKLRRGSWNKWRAKKRAEEAKAAEDSTPNTRVSGISPGFNPWRRNPKPSGGAMADTVVSKTTP